MPSLSFHDKQHVLRLLQQQGQVKRIFDEFARKSGSLLSKWIEDNNDNVWIHNKIIEKQIDELICQLHEDLLININTTTKAAWKESNIKTDDLIKSFIKDLSISEAVKNGMFSRNMDAFKAFKNQKIEGLTVSDRVWKIAEGAKENLEYYLSSGISTGRPSVSISRDIRQLLKNPDKRFRRIRNSEGKLILSKPMKEYHPGQGIYRSSFKNALRVTSTQTNMSYHLSDYERWKKLDFVLGIEVNRSPSAKDPCPICDAMVGIYPKEYKFIGNHPWCICQAVPKMLSGEEFTSFLLTNNVPEGKIIKSMPQSAVEYVSESKSMQKSFIVQQNQQYFKIKK